MEWAAAAERKDGKGKIRLWTKSTNTQKNGNGLRVAAHLFLIF
jgi:hypothetical protein